MAERKLTERQLAILTRLYEPFDDSTPDKRTLEALQKRHLVFCSPHGRWRVSAAGAKLVRESRG